MRWVAMPSACPRMSARLFRTLLDGGGEAVNYLTGGLGENGLHSQAFDLWEKFRGSFIYSNASIYAALQTAAAWAAARDEEETAQIWDNAAARINGAVRECWNGACFARGYNESGQLDWGVDSAMLGMFIPFGLLSLDVPEEREMVESMVQVIRDRLTKRLPEGNGIIRHEGDDYAGGAAGGVNTLWFAQVLLELALYYAQRDQEKSAAYRGSGTYMRTVIARGTTTGLLPELIGSDTVSRWAVPHGWALASSLSAPCCSTNWPMCHRQGKRTRMGSRSSTMCCESA